jgi:hypothetical protein
VISRNTSRRVRRVTVARATRSVPRAALAYCIVNDTVLPWRRSGTSAPDHAAAIAAVSASAAIAPPWTVSPMVARSSR